MIDPVLRQLLLSRTGGLLLATAVWAFADYNHKAIAWCSARAENQRRQSTPIAPSAVQLRMG